MNFQDLPKDLFQKFKKQDPTEWINNLEKSEIPNVFINKPLPELVPNKPIIFILIGPSGAGKDTSIEKVLQDGTAVQGITATSRARRINENEPEDKYTWMTETQLPDETNEQYENRLAEIYDLVEHDSHQGSVYGLPRSNLSKAASTGKPVVIRTENKALPILVSKLKQDYNIVTVCIIAPSYEELFERIKDRNNVLERMTKAPDEIKDAKKHINFVVLNSSNPSDPDSAIHAVQSSMEQLITSIHS